ncbi:Hypothetical predicted protein [Octopus vulgaris]|nr:Hypothetical predicted protein [Octopus vulgaris]
MMRFGGPNCWNQSNSTSNWAVAIGVGVVTVSGLLYVLKRCKCKRKIDYPKDVIILHLIPRLKDTPNLSPFAVKLETYLRMTKLPYQVDYCFDMSPKHKTPWITYNGEVVSDSQFIIEYLNEKFNIDLSSHLTDEQRGVARAMRKMLEEDLLWALALSRWVYGYSDPSLRKVIPAPRFFVWRIKRMLEKYAYGQGMGRHTPSEVEHIAMGDLKALSDFLGKKKFLMGVNPCETDCAVFGMMSSFEKMPDGSFFTKVLKDKLFPNLDAYRERMKELYWPDWVIPGWEGPVMGLQPRRP